MGKFEEALKDFEVICKAQPNNEDFQEGRKKCFLAIK